MSAEPPSSPASVHVGARALPDWVRRSKLALTALILAVLPFGSWGACVTGVLDQDDGASFITWVVTAVLALIGGVMAIVSLVRLGKQRDDRVSGKRLSVLALVLGFLSPVATFFLGFFTMDINFGHGRALRRNGKALVPRDVDVDEEWLLPQTLSVPADLVASVADAWRSSGATEAASVIAFDHLADELAARGAPAALVDGARANAADEVAHARLCYSLAAAVDGCARGHGVLDVDRADHGDDLVAFAKDNVVESCVFEGAAADVARVLKDSAVDDDVRAVLATIAVDEAKHADHGWAVVDWCRHRRGDDVVDACRRAVQQLDPARVTCGAPDGLERFGVAGPTLWRAALARERARCLARLQPVFSSSRL